MAQYIAFDENVEVSGKSILGFVNAIPMFRDKMIGVLRKNGIDDLQADKWYPIACNLNAYKDIGEHYGANTLFSIGKSIPEHAEFPPEIDNLEKALTSINVAYHMNHRNGEIGYYKLTKFNEEDKLAIMECHNPYPSNFDRGVITAITRKFKPSQVLKIDVELDTSLPSRLDGADVCTYRISW